MILALRAFEKLNGRRFVVLLSPARQAISLPGRPFQELPCATSWPPDPTNEALAHAQYGPACIEMIARPEEAPPSLSRGFPWHRWLFDPYRMTDCKCGLSVRYAMLFYVLKRLGLLGDATNADPRQQHNVLLNKDDVQAALERAELFRYKSKAGGRHSATVKAEDSADRHRAPTLPEHEIFPYHWFTLWVFR